MTDLEKVKQYLSDELPFKAFVLIVDESEFRDDGTSVPKFDFIMDDHSTVFTALGLLESTRFIMMKGFD